MQRSVTTAEIKIFLYHVLLQSAVDKVSWRICINRTRNAISAANSTRLLIKQLNWKWHFFWNLICLATAYNHEFISQVTFKQVSETFTAETKNWDWSALDLAVTAEVTAINGEHLLKCTLAQTRLWLMVIEYATPGHTCELYRLSVNEKKNESVYFLAWLENRDVHI